MIMVNVKKNIYSGLINNSLFIIQRKNNNINNNHIILFWFFLVRINSNNCVHIKSRNKRVTKGIGRRFRAGIGYVQHYEIFKV